MATVTPNFNWPVPTSTDLVKDGATAIEALGDSIDASLVDLKGGTTGQVLSKNSNTDMDFVWVTDAAGDITGVTATSPLTGGGTSGTVTVGIQDASTSQKGSVQLSDSTSTTSSVLAATPTAVKSAYDLAAAAIPKSTVTTNGDVIYATGSSAVTRLGIGSTGQVLTVAGGVPTWATAGGGGAMVQIADTTLSSAAADITFSSIASSYNHLMIIISGKCSSVSFNGTDLSVQLNSDTGTNYRNARNTKYATAGATVTIEGAPANKFELGNIWTGSATSYNNASVQMTFPNYKATTLNKTMIFSGGAISDAVAAGTGLSLWDNTAAITTIKIFSSGGGNLAIGTRATLYGLV
jgi:hypothetical protein